MSVLSFLFFFFFFNDTATTEIYTLSLHDALPISSRRVASLTQTDGSAQTFSYVQIGNEWRVQTATDALRSEEHTSELQSQFHLVCRLLLEKKKNKKKRKEKK